MKRDIEDIRDRLLEFCNMFGFDYNGHSCGVDPFNKQSFHLCCDGKVLEVHSIEDVFTTPYFGGKALKDIVDDIDIVEW